MVLAAGCLRCSLVFVVRLPSGECAVLFLDHALYLAQFVHWRLWEACVGQSLSRLVSRIHFSTEVQKGMQFELHEDPRVAARQLMNFLARPPGIADSTERSTAPSTEKSGPACRTSQDRAKAEEGQARTGSKQNE